MSRVGVRFATELRAPTFELGQVLAGRFRIVRFLAAGGVGEVYEVEDEELRERLALKVLRPESAGREPDATRFRREVQLARRVTHPNVCRLFEVFHHAVPQEEEDGPPLSFVVMELLEGETLYRRLERRGRLSTGEALPIVRQIAAALAAAHRAGVVHRDLKAANVMLVPADGGERVVVTDFGLARVGSSFQSTRAELVATQTGELAGTPAYMAPEQIEGGELTAAADLYSLGVLMFKLVTGRFPFQGATPLAMAFERMRRDPPSPREVVADLDPRWEAAILGCLARAPAERFETALDVVRALEAESPAHPTSADAERRRLATAALLVLVALAVLGLYRWRSTADFAAAGPRLEPRTVAVLGFENRSGGRQAAWVGTVLDEMLATELALGEGLRLIPGESVARARLELSATGPAPLSPELLGRLREHLGADLVMAGSYSAPERRLRVESQLYDAASGELVEAAGEEGREAELLALVERLGERLRGALDAAEPPRVEAGVVRPSGPPGPRALRLYGEGLEHLHRLDLPAARRALERAVAAAPGSPLPRAALAEVWSAAGYEAKALGEARRAYELSAGLPLVEALRVEGRYREAAREWPRAIEVYRRLRRLAPGSADPGLRLAAAQTAAGRAAEALETLAELRRLPPPAGGDPRIALAEAVALGSLAQHRRAAAAAERAIAGGEAEGARLLAARARYRQALAYLRTGRLEDAGRTAAQAQAVFTEMGDRVGLSRALNVTAAIAASRGDLEAGRRAWQETVEACRQIGHPPCLSGALNNLAIVQRLSGELAAAQQALEQALTLARRSGDRRGVANRLGNLGELLGARGQLVAARACQEEALELARALGERREEALNLSRLGILELAADDVGAARRRFAAALAIQDRLELVEAATTRLAAAGLELVVGRAAAAETLARSAAEAFRRQQRGTDEARARALLARALLAGGEVTQAWREAERALALVEGSQGLGQRLEVELELARLEAASGELAGAAERFEVVRSTAAGVGLAALVLEARLEKAALELAMGGGEPARSELLAAAEEATRAGYRSPARRAAEALEGVGR